MPLPFNLKHFIVYFKLRPFTHTKWCKWLQNVSKIHHICTLTIRFDTINYQNVSPSTRTVRPHYETSLFAMRQIIFKPCQKFTFNAYHCLFIQQPEVRNTTKTITGIKNTVRILFPSSNADETVFQRDLCKWCIVNTFQELFPNNSIKR